MLGWTVLRKATQEIQRQSKSPPTVSPQGGHWLVQATWYHHGICLKVWKRAAGSRDQEEKAKLQIEDIPSFSLGLRDTYRLLLQVMHYNTISVHTVTQQLRRFKESDKELFNAWIQLCYVQRSQSAAEAGLYHNYHNKFKQHKHRTHSQIWQLIRGRVWPQWFVLIDSVKGKSYRNTFHSIIGLAH